MIGKEQHYETAPVAEWRLPEDGPIPSGMVQLLSIYGKATYGTWQNNGYWVAWAPFLKMSPRIKERMLEQEKNWRKA